MEFYENRSRAPFKGFVLIWHAWKHWRARRKTQRVLQHLSNEQLKDIGLSRSDVADPLDKTWPR
ncbi:MULTISPECIES: DUF1127 domain-containing protein [Mangrovibacter]|uniref:Uncharacterized protein YjiS (DUF1127 family) n=1 Tax=Mangrovibacter plantisponsor TaxID=451513 RepID=A0A317Q3I6_9ENTR|nr:MULTISPECIES: DUF1127 domain-containing protein [Mangrovibacter]KEA52057.1 hypothetical protein DT73_14210 [Mangrovibacter sp. MFB070]PWW08113.1 uncharacterized protein YjiS (DUF1127 family) [Mangrovibacter plantisponsor]